MSDRLHADINPAVLAWARKARGFSLEIAAKALDQTVEKVEAWESGDAKPTIPQLRKIAHVYKRHMAIFYLDVVPQDRPPPSDFRRLPEAETEEFTPELLLAIRRISDKQQAASDIAEYGPSYDWGFLGSVTLASDPEYVGSQIRDLLGMTDRKQVEWIDDSAAYRGWRSAIESIGVMVFQMSRVELSEVRGLSISRSPYPVIAVNSKDKFYSRAFTLIHEFCHLLLDDPGVCTLDEGKQIEVFCNHATGAALVPGASLRDSDVVRDHGLSPIWTDAELALLARRFKVSTEVALRRLLITGRTTQDYYNAKRAEWLSRPLPPPQDGGGGTLGHVQALRSQGMTYIRLVLEAFHQRVITASDIPDYLDMHLKHLPALEQAVQEGG